MRRAALALLLLGAGCGTGTDGKPVAPPTSPEPAPAPPPPTVRAVVQIISEPSGPDGYSEGETIRALADFERWVSVEGSPRLAIEIGEHVRLAEFLTWWEHDWPPERPSQGWRFDYRVGADDADADGITVPADAFDLTDGAFLADGVEIEAEIDAVASAHISKEHVQVGPGKPLDAHRVLGRPEARVCTDERTLAMNHSKFVQEWDGTPYRVDIIRNFPEVVSEADLVQLLEPVALLADKIEDQLGYRIVERGTVIPVPAGMRPGWNSDAERFRRTCPLPRDPGEIQGFYMDQTLDYAPGSDGQAHSRCGAFTYLQPVLLEWPCPGCEKDALTMHELFHVLGFVHVDDYNFLERGVGVPMSAPLTWWGWPGAETVMWSDIDLLRCIFPEGA